MFIEPAFWRTIRNKKCLITFVRASRFNRDCGSKTKLFIFKKRNLARTHAGTVPIFFPVNFLKKNKNMTSVETSQEDLSNDVIKTGRFFTRSRPPKSRLSPLFKKRKKEKKKGDTHNVITLSSFTLAVFKRLSWFLDWWKAPGTAQRPTVSTRYIRRRGVSYCDAIEGSSLEWKVVCFLGKLFAGTSLLFSVEYREACRLSYVKYIFLGYLYCQHFITTSGDYYSARINNSNNIG